MRRVVITGIGMVSPLGGDVTTSWNSLINGNSGIKKIPQELFDTTDLPCKIAGLIPVHSEEGALDINKYISKADSFKMDKFIMYSIAAAEQAIVDCEWVPTSEKEQNETGVLIGSGIGGLNFLVNSINQISAEGLHFVSPFFIPASLINLASGHISIKYKCKGPSISISTACSTGAHAIGEAARIIQRGDANVMIAGGSEAAVCRLGIAGFAAAKALSTHFNDTPSLASRPWDKARDGFVMGEGCGILILEGLEHAMQRGAKIYAELIGYGATSDAHHITLPNSDGGRRAMQAALKSAKITPAQVDYINAHSTSTILGDVSEIDAIKAVFTENSNKLAVSSTKSSTGHLLGAAGSVEAIFTILAIVNNTIPPTLNLNQPYAEDIGINLVPNISIERNVNVALSNSFAFGGTNACLIFSKLKIE